MYPCLVKKTNIIYLKQLTTNQLLKLIPLILQLHVQCRLINNLTRLASQFNTFAAVGFLQLVQELFFLQPLYLTIYSFCNICKWISEATHATIKLLQLGQCLNSVTFVTDYNVMQQLENKRRQFWFCCHMLSGNGQARPYLE